jgi:hypothetical protein
MPTPVTIKFGPYEVKVTPLGQLVIAPLAYDETEFRELAELDTAYNFYKPRSGQQIVITGIRAKADRQVSNTVDADVVIYEAISETTLTVDKVLHREAMVRGESFTFTPLNILVRAGKYINAKTTDDNIYMTLMGYSVPAVI